MTVIAVCPNGFAHFIANCFTSFPAANTNSSKAVHHYFPITCSLAMKDYFFITGTPRTLINSCSGLKPPPTVICPHIGIS